MSSILQPSNGHPKGPDLSKSALFVGWNPETQQVTLHHDDQQARTWEFVIALLEQAKLVAEFNLRMAQSQAVAMQQMAMQQEQQMAQDQINMVGALTSGRRGRT